MFSSPIFLRRSTSYIRFSVSYYPASGVRMSLLCTRAMKDRYVSPTTPLGGHSPITLMLGTTYFEMRFTKETFCLRTSDLTMQYVDIVTKPLPHEVFEEHSW